MYDAIINGRIVTENEIVEGDILFDEKGIIQAIIPGGIQEKDGYEIGNKIDAAFHYVVPGGIDGHVHFGGFGQIPIADDFYTGSLAALKGGTTTVVDFCEPYPGQSAMECIQQRKQDAKKAAIDYAFHFCFTEDYRTELDSINDIISEGIGAFKAFTCYEHTSLKPGDFRSIMEVIHDKGSLLVHAEEKSIIDCMQEKFTNRKNDMLSLSLTRPNISEKIAVSSILELAKESGTKLCIAHASTKEAARIKEEERDNKDFVLETCPHYLNFTNDYLKGADGALYTMNPPLREKGDVEELWRAIENENISILSTDHCSYLNKYKHGNTYLSVPCGVDGIQTRMHFAFSEGVKKRNISLHNFVNLTALNAAKFYNLYPQKGCIRKGSDADFAIINPNISWTYNASQIAGATDYTIFDGFVFNGKLEYVIKGGKVVCDHDRVIVKEGSGKFISSVIKDGWKGI